MNEPREIPRDRARRCVIVPLRLPPTVWREAPFPSGILEVK